MSFKPSMRVRGVMALLLMLAVFGTTLLIADHARRSGEEVLLETRPIDPRDLFFGHYAILSYGLLNGDVSDFADAALKTRIEDEDLDTGTILYAALAPGEIFHDVVLVTEDLDVAAARGVPLKVETLNRAVFGGRGLRVTADLPGRYYADPETALALETAARNAARARPQTAGEADAAEDAVEVPLFGVLLSVSSSGEAVLKGVRLGDVTYVDTLTGDRLRLSTAEK